MKTSFRRFITADKLELVGLLYEPEAGTKEVLVHVHGMAGNFYENKFLDAIAHTLTNSGTAFFTFNNRGCEFIKDLTRYDGERRKIVRYGDTFERFTDCLIDIKAAIDYVSGNGYTEIHISGHSLGGPKVGYYLSKTQDNHIASVIFLSPADMIGLAIADKNYEADMITARMMVKEGKGAEIMPNIVWEDCYLSAQTFLDFSDQESEVGVFNLHDQDDPLPVLGSIKVPTITIMGKKDSALSVPIEEMMTRIKAAMHTSPKVETVILGDANHGYYGHEQQLADEIKRWIQNL